MTSPRRLLPAPIPSQPHPAQPHPSHPHPSDFSGFEVHREPLLTRTDPTLAPSESIRATLAAPHAAFPDAEAVEVRLRRRALLANAAAWVPVLGLVLAVGIWLGLLPALGVLLLQLLVLGLSLLSTFFTNSRSLSKVEMHPITSRTQPEIHDLCEDVATRLGIPLPACYILEDPALNAYATLTSPSSPVMILTTGFLEEATPDALRGVLAHEFAHIANKDLLVSVLTLGSGRMLSSFASSLAPKKKASWERESPTEALVRLPFAVVGSLVPAFYSLLFLGVKRSRESLADLTAARALGGADPILACLRLLSSADRKTRRGHAADISRSAEAWSTHPHTSKRIQLILDTCSAQVSLLRS